MAVIAYKPSVKPTQMVRRRQARKVADGLYEVISRDGTYRHRVHVLPNGDTICTSRQCTAAQHDRVCWAQLRALKRWAREVRS